MKRENKASEIKFPAFQSALLELQGDMTIEEFAKKIGLSRATTGFYISGSRLPDALRLRQIAEACNVSVDWLVGLSNESSRTCEITQISNTTGLSAGLVERIIASKNAKINEDGLFLDFINDLFSPGYGGPLLIIYLFRLMGSAEAVKIWNNTWDTIYTEYESEKGTELISKEDESELHRRYIEALEKIILSDDIPSNTKEPLELILEIQKNEHDTLAKKMFELDCKELCDIDRAKVMREFNYILSLVEG